MLNIGMVAYVSGGGWVGARGRRGAGGEARCLLHERDGWEVSVQSCRGAAALVRTSVVNDASFSQPREREALLRVSQIYDAVHAFRRLDLVGVAFLRQLDQPATHRRSL